MSDNVSQWPTVEDIARRFHDETPRLYVGSAGWDEAHKGYRRSVIAAVESVVGPLLERLADAERQCWEMATRAGERDRRIGELEAERDEWIARRSVQVHVDGNAPTEDE